MPFTIPPPNKTQGQAGFMADIDALYAAVAALAGINVQNTAYAGGARGDGVSDDTAAIQAALAAASVAGGVVYFPPGDYLITSGLTYSAAFPLVMAGATTSGHLGRRAGASMLHMNFAPGHAITVTGSPYFRWQDLDVLVDGTNSGGATADYAAIYTSGVTYVQADRFFISKGTGNVSINTAIRMVNALSAVIRNGDVGAETQGIWQDGGAGITIEDTQITTTVGTGFGAIRMDNTAGTGAATIQLSNVTTFRGDWGFYAGGSGNSPLFVYMNNVQINNPRKGGIYFQAGSQFWGDYVWISMVGTPGGFNTTGVLLDTGFQGWFYLFNSVIQAPSNHGVWIKAGQGFVFGGVSFGIIGSAAANTYDDLHIAAAAKNVTVTGCHFDTDQFNGLASPPARSAVYVEAGATSVNVQGCQIGSGYGTGPVVNNSAAAFVWFKDNIGYNPVGAVSAPAVPASGTPQANITGVNCSVFVSGGTVSQIQVNGVTTGLTTGQFQIPAGGTIMLTYTAAPAWTWIGH